MPTRAQRSRSLRRLVRKTPGGTRKKVFGIRRPSQASCANCGGKLAGVQRETPSKISKLSLTKKRPKRMFGGNICSSCSRKTIKEAVFKRFEATV